MRGTTTSTGVVRVNLLPPEIAEKAKLRKAQGAMVATGLAAVAVIGLMYTQQTAKVAAAEEAKTEALTAHSKLRAEQAKLQNVRETYAQVDAAKATLASAMQYDIRWSGYLHDLTLRIPDNVWLTNLTATVTAAGGQTTGQPAAQGGALDQGVGTVTFAGVAFAHNDVASWLESLAKQKGYANPYFTQSREDKIGERTVVRYESKVTLNDAALSKRHTKGLGR